MYCLAESFKIEFYAFEKVLSKLIRIEMKYIVFYNLKIERISTSISFFFR